MTTWHLSNVSKNSNISKIAISVNNLHKYYLKYLKVVLKLKNAVYSVVLYLKAVVVIVLIVVTL